MNTKLTTTKVISYKFYGSPSVYLSHNIDICFDEIKHDKPTSDATDVRGNCQTLNI